MTIWSYGDRFTETPQEHRLTLGEGATPIVRSRSIGPATGLGQLFFKLENVNPTGSYKDRFAAAAVSEMCAREQKKCLATSSGNTGAALAAYCAAASIPCQIAIVETAPADKLTQMLAHGAVLFRVEGFGLDPNITADVFALLESQSERPDTGLQISAYRYSPGGMSGVQTIAYELVDQLDGPIGDIFCPAGGGGLTLAIARGMLDGAGAGGLGARVHCVQPAGNDTIAGSLRRGEPRAQSVTCTTEISGLQVPSVIDGDEVIAACGATGGTGYLVADGEVYETQARLAQEEGILCEPAGAVALAGALQAHRRGELTAEEAVVCLVTGAGFKDSGALQKLAAQQSCAAVSLRELDERLSG